MLHTALSLLREELNAFILQHDSTATTDQVLLGNIALFDTTDGGGMRNKVVLSVVNIQEEETLRNSPPIKRQQGTKLIIENPPLYLNLYLLFTANWPTEYDNAIKRLEQVMMFFQQQKKFTLNTSPAFARTADLDDTKLMDISLTVELYTMTFEQINHLWGTLGGKQLPAALYRVRCSELKYDKPQRQGAPITEIKGII